MKISFLHFEFSLNFSSKAMSVISKNEIFVLIGHLVYVGTLLCGSLYISDVSKKILFYGVGLGVGHFLIFLPGLIELIKEHDRKSVVFFYIGFQLLLVAQDMYPVHLDAAHDKSAIAKDYRERMMMVFYIVYGVCEGLGTLLIAGSVYWIQFFDPSKVEKAGLLKGLMVVGLFLGIIGSTLYSLSELEWVHHTGTGIIGTSTIISTFAFIAGRWNWLKPEIKENINWPTKPKRAEVDKEPLLKRIKPVKIPKPGPVSPRHGTV